MEIIKSYATKNLCYIANKKMKPKGIVVHSTGAKNPNLSRYVDCPNEVGINTNGNHWNQATPSGRKVCVHAFIGYDKNKTVRVAEILPLDVCCWGVGKGKNGSYNYDPSYIQFEICEDGLKDAKYYRQAFGVAEEYCAYLCKTFGLSVNTIVSHKEAHKNGYGSNHGDPEHWMKQFGDSMDAFRNRVSALLGKNSEHTDPPMIFSNGDLVSISGTAVYYNGKSIPKWVKSQLWIVRGIQKGDRVVIDKSKDGKYSICSAINAKYLTAVKQPETTTNDSSQKTPPYLVKITACALNIRKGAGMNTAKVGVISDKGVYTIIEERKGYGAMLWGKLKSGAGWISLDYVEKL